MSLENIITLVSASLSFFASVLAIVVSVYNNRFTRFTSERWWERKADAYNNIVKNLVALIDTANQWIQADSEYLLGEYTTGSAMGYSKKEFYEARTRLKQFATEGNYIFTTKATDALSALIKKLEEDYSLDSDIHDTELQELEADFSDIETTMKYLDNSRVAANECLKIVRKEAKADLNVR